jgi:hypothetical protein
MIALIVSLASSPSQAHLFGIKHVEPTPLPDGKSNFTSVTFTPYTDPNFTDIDNGLAYDEVALRSLWKEAQVLAFRLHIIIFDSGERIHGVLGVTLVHVTE